MERDHSARLKRRRMACERSCCARFILTLDDAEVRLLCCLGASPPPTLVAPPSEARRCVLLASSRGENVETVHLVTWPQAPAFAPTAPSSAPLPVSPDGARAFSTSFEWTHRWTSTAQACWASWTGWAVCALETAVASQTAGNYWLPISSAALANGLASRSDRCGNGRVSALE